MLLEIINSSLTYTLHVNPHFVYSLLYQREIFTPYHGRPGFIDLVNNIEMVKEEEGERETEGERQRVFYWIIILKL